MTLRCVAMAPEIKVALTYLIVAAGILLSNFAWNASTLYVTEIPVLLSLVLLLPLYLWQRQYRKTVNLKDAASAENAGAVYSLTAVLLLLALFVRIPSVLWFGKPFEKTPLIYLLVMTVLLLERADLSGFGFRTERIGRSFLCGLGLLATLGGVIWGSSYGIIYVFTGILPIESFDVVTFVLNMPFMTLCVGISEEALFRGYMQTRLSQRSSRNRAILVQAALFGVWHFVWDLSPFRPIGMLLYVGSTFLFGLAFGYFYSKVKNLVPLVLAHGLWNSIVSSIIDSQQAVDAFAGAPAFAQMALAVCPHVLGLTVTVILTRLLVKENPDG